MKVIYEKIICVEMLNNKIRLFMTVTNIRAVKVNLDISGSPTESQRGSR